jgi:hypothetical protein
MVEQPAFDWRSDPPPSSTMIRLFVFRPSERDYKLPIGYRQLPWQTYN